MADERANGIVLRTRMLTETSLIVHWLTREAGRIATVAKGARRSKSPFRGKLDLFYVAEFSFARSARSELHTLREVTLLEIHHLVRENFELLQQAAYAAALLEQTLETETPVPEMFELFSGFLTQLQPPSSPSLILAFELKLLDQLGLKPDLATSSLSPGARRIAEHLVQQAWPELPSLKLSEAQTGELRRFLHGFLIYHLGRIPRGRGVALRAND